MMPRIYLDHAATTPLDPHVVEAMQPWLQTEFGNPSSLHAEGRRARQAIDEAREVVSTRLGCLFGEVLFTSSGTEAANMAILGSALEALKSGNSRRKILLGSAEHHCVLHTIPLLQTLGFEVELIPVDREAMVDVNSLRALLDPRVLLVSLMHANNELGTIQPIAAWAPIIKEHGALFHTDAVQTFGAMSATVDDLGVDMMSVSAHKIYGPKGVGALYLRSGVKITPISVGGGQERDVRAGTENVAGIVGFGEAVRRIASTSSATRDSFYEHLRGHWQQTVASTTLTLPGHAHIRFPGVGAESMLIRLDRMGLGASSGAACSSGSVEASHVLLACGFTESEAREGLRFTFGRGQDAETGRVAAAIVSQAAAEILSGRRS